LGRGGAGWGEVVRVGARWCGLGRGGAGALGRPCTHTADDARSKQGQGREPQRGPGACRPEASRRDSRPCQTSGVCIGPGPQVERTRPSSPLEALKEGLRQPRALRGLRQHCRRQLAGVANEHDAAAWGKDVASALGWACWAGGLWRAGKARPALCGRRATRGAAMAALLAPSEEQESANPGQQLPPDRPAPGLSSCIGMSVAGSSAW
jgi:hypothetical protein